MAKSTIFSATLVATLMSNPVLAFTNGSLVPSYLCNPVADGLPKTFGQVLGFTREQTPTVAFNTNKAQNVAAPPLPQKNASSVGNSAYILASLHDSPNSIQTKQNTLIITMAKGNSIVAGQANAITISTTDASQLKGAVVVGQDSTGQRQGSFTDAPGGPFIPFQGCGPNAQGQTSGVIQQTGITAQSSYSKLVFNAPACIPGGNITFAGLTVTGSGFGQWVQTIQVTGSTCGGATSGKGNTPAGSQSAAASKPSVAASKPAAAQQGSGKESKSAAAQSSATSSGSAAAAASSRSVAAALPAKAVASGCGSKGPRISTTPIAAAQNVKLTTLVKSFQTVTTTYV